MFLASNCTCAVYFTYTAHVQLLAKNMAATHVHAICTRICIRNQTNTLCFCREDNPLYVFTLWYRTPLANVLLGLNYFDKFSLLTVQTDKFSTWPIHASFSTSALVIAKNWQSGAYRQANSTCHMKTCHRKLVRL